MAHWSFCAVHNEPALPKGECDCGDDAPESDIVARLRKSAEDCDREDRLDLSEQHDLQMEAAAKIERLNNAPDDVWISVNSMNATISEFCRSYMVPLNGMAAFSPAVAHVEFNLTAYIRHVLETRDAQR